MSSETSYKIVMLGDASVGKTHFVSRYLRDSLPKAPAATIGVEFATKVVTLPSGTVVRAQIWDTAGQEKYRSIVSVHYRRAVGALLLFDLTKRASFLNVAKWVDELRHQSEPDIVIMLVGNKYDLVENNPSAREVTTEQARQYAERNGLLFTEASAVTGYKVNESFQTLMQAVHEQYLRSGKANAPPSGPGVGIQPREFAKEYNKTLGNEMTFSGGEKESGCCGLVWS